MRHDDQPPYRADHVGSLLRPPELLAAREDAARGLISPADLRAREDAAIGDAVAMQAGIGLRSATDGEMRRASWHMDFIYQLGGISRSSQSMTVHFRNEAGEMEFTPPALVIDGRITLDHPIFLEDFKFLAEAVLPKGVPAEAAPSGAARSEAAPDETARSATPKLTIPSPSMVHYRGGRAAVDERVYPDLEGFFDDLSAAYAAEIAALGAAGCTYLQLDDTSLAYLNDPAQRAALAARGDDPDTQHLRYIRQLNAALADRPAGMRVTVHLCRGNFRSAWAAEGSYEHVAEALFSELDVDGFFLEFDDERSGGFEPLRFVPPSKQVVLGLVTTKRPALESKDVLKRRIEEASRVLPLEQLCLSPQCGFSSTLEGNDLTIDDEVAKLRLVVETAADVWG
ncbi:MAG TPA: 5-methyltetrahydropteroyltriglutamate--homocysteine S-methyltransferase [Acidimicrobiales bacterium]|nr:5-methyltetrahydropteroyltriglutamate--homocysteine S-methyltransferase [Acidimicrobiales bacterium]